MSKFGELVNKDIPVLLFFFNEWSEDSNEMVAIVRSVAANYGGFVNVVKIDVDKNQELSEALRIKHLPTMMIYFRGEQMWRVSGAISESTIDKAIERLLE